MASGVGEAPCQVLSYESDGLPSEYRGSLLVASWADHRVERYVLKERGASVAAERKPFVQGGKDFRPVGIAVAPDGSLFVSDWVKSDYTLHGKGAVWHIRSQPRRRVDRPDDPARALTSAHRPLREDAARRLIVAGRREFVREHLGSTDVRVRAASLAALIDAQDPKLNLAQFAARESVVPLRAVAARTLAERGKDVRRFLEADQPGAVRMAAVRILKKDSDWPRLRKLLSDPDPFLRHAAVQQLARFSDRFGSVPVRSLRDPAERLGMLLASRASGRPEGLRLLGDVFLDDPDEDVRFLAAKWVADQKLTAFRPRLAAALKDRQLNVRLFFAYSAALARLDGKDANEGEMADYFFDRLRDDRGTADLRVLALQMVPPGYRKLTPDFLAGLLDGSEPALQREAARALSDSPSPGRLPLLRAVLFNPKLPDTVRAQALVGLAGQAQQMQGDLLRLAEGGNPVLADEALRNLIQTRLGPKEQAALEAEARRRPAAAPLVARVLGRPFATARPPATALDAWLKRLDGRADADAGRRVFFHPKLAACFRCHRAEGRGQRVGPDLSTVGRSGRRHILESILQPSALVAPHYQSWQVETADGRVRTGLLVRTELDDYTYLDAKGELFKVNTRDVVESRPVPQSIMPDGLADLLTDQEMRDLMAYLEERR
jgi:putative heme-binding domain-containing protein